jgi:putative transposase
MSRHPRPVFKNVPLHIVQRGNNRNPCFFSPLDYHVYLAMLAQSAAEFGCSVHAYVLMTNHVHILASPSEVTSPALMMKGLGERYVPYANRRYGRYGTLWQGRYQSCLVDSEQYFLVCQRYIELNPVRAGLVSDPADYEWSSYKANAHGTTNKLVTPHPVYTGLGTEICQRQSNYRALFQDAIPELLLEQVRHATNRNGAFGSPQFVDEIGSVLGRKLNRQYIRRKPV